MVNGSRQMNSTGLRAHGTLSRIQIIVGSSSASDADDGQDRQLATRP